MKRKTMMRQLEEFGKKYNYYILIWFGMAGGILLDLDWAALIIGPLIWFSFEYFIFSKSKGKLK